MVVSGAAVPFAADRQDFLTGEDLAGATSVILEIAGCRSEVAIQPSGNPRFSGRRVVTTLSKDNPLAWICDSARLNAKVDGADAVLPIRQRIASL